MRVAVVGAGAAGCVAARILAERGHDTVLFEAGPGHPRPRVLDELDHLRSPEAMEWWWPKTPPRGRGLGGSTSVNGMLLHGVDPLDARRWGWDDAAENQAAVLDRFDSMVTRSMAPFTRTFGDLVSRGNPIAPPTATSGGEGWSPLTLAATDGRRRSAADAFLTQPPPNLDVRPDTTVVSVSDHSLSLADGEVFVADHIVLAAGTIGSPRLLIESDIVSSSDVDDSLNHSSSAIIVELAPELRSVDSGAPPSSRLLRLQTGLTENTVVDLQMLVLDHTGHDDVGRSHGAVLVSALEPNRIKVLAEGVTQALRWLGEIDGVSALSLSPDASPVQHQCCSLARHLDGGNELPSHPSISVVDASALPALPHTNPMLSVMTGAHRWAATFSG